MRVLHLSSLYPPFSIGGAERVVEMLAEGSAANGIHVGVAHLAPQPMPPVRRNLVDVRPLTHRNPLWIGNSASHIGVVRKFNKVVTLFNALTSEDFKKVLDEYQPDIVHSHSMVELTPRMWKSAKDWGAVIVHTLHDYDLLCIRAALYKDDARCTRTHLTCAAFSSIKRYYHSNIDHVVGVSRAILQTHEERGFFEGIPPLRRHVIWNPVRSVTPAAERPARSGPLTFGFLGRLVPEKGIVQLLDACERMADVGGWRLKIAGQAPRDDAFLRERLGNLPVELVGFVEPAEFFRDIDVLVVPSVWLEPFGLTIVEAYAHGVSVIGSDIAGVAEIVGSVDAGALFRADDVDALADKMLCIVQGGREALVPADTTEVLQRTRPENVVQQYMDVYRSALQLDEA